MPRRRAEHVLDAAVRHALAERVIEVAVRGAEDALHAARRGRADHDRTLFVLHRPVSARGLAIRAELADVREHTGARDRRDLLGGVTGRLGLRGGIRVRCACGEGEAGGHATRDCLAKSMGRAPRLKGDQWVVRRPTTVADLRKVSERESASRQRRPRARCEIGDATDGRRQALRRDVARGALLACSRMSDAMTFTIFRRSAAVAFPRRRRSSSTLCSVARRTARSARGGRRGARGEGRFAVVSTGSGAALGFGEAHGHEGQPARAAAAVVGRSALVVRSSVRRAHARAARAFGDVPKDQGGRLGRLAARLR